MGSSYITHTLVSSDYYPHQKKTVFNGLAGAFHATLLSYLGSSDLYNRIVCGDSVWFRTLPPAWLRWRLMGNDLVVAEPLALLAALA